MRAYRVRVYEDMYLVDNGTGTDTRVVEMGGLEAAIALNPAKAKRTYPKGTRKRRKAVETKPEETAA